MRSISTFIEELLCLLDDLIAVQARDGVVRISFCRHPICTTNLLVQNTILLLYSGANQFVPRTSGNFRLLRCIYCERALALKYTDMDTILAHLTLLVQIQGLCAIQYTTSSNAIVRKLQDSLGPNRSLENLNRWLLVKALPHFLPFISCYGHT